MGAECQKCINVQAEIAPREHFEGSNSASLQSSKEISTVKAAMPTPKHTPIQSHLFQPKEPQREAKRVESQSPTTNFKDPNQNVAQAQIEPQRQEGPEELKEGNSVLYELPKEGDLTSKVFKIPLGRNMTLEKKASNLSHTSNLPQNPERQANSLGGTYKSIRQQEDSDGFQLLDPAVALGNRGSIRDN